MFSVNHERRFDVKKARLMRLEDNGCSKILESFIMFERNYMKVHSLKGCITRTPTRGINQGLCSALAPRLVGSDRVRASPEEAPRKQRSSHFVVNEKVEIEGPGTSPLGLH